MPEAYRTITLAKEHLNLVKTVSTDETRLGLVGLLVKGSTISATDGHRMVVLDLPVQTQPDGKVLEAHEPTLLWFEAPGKIAKGHEFVTIHLEHENVSLPTVSAGGQKIIGRFYTKGNGYAAGKLLDPRTFPSLKSVVPQEDKSNGMVIGLDVAHLTKVGALLGATKVVLQFRPEMLNGHHVLDPLGAVRVAPMGSTTYNGYAVVMPDRMDV